MSQWVVKNVCDASEAFNFGAGLIGANLNPLPTGFHSWDAACMETDGKGIPQGYYVIIGGASNAGKTQCLNHLLRQAMDFDMNPGLITMEVPIHGIQRSLYSQVTSFGFGDLLPAKFEDGDASEKTVRLAEEVSRWADGRRELIVAEHDGAPSIYDIVDMCYALKEAGCAVIGIDHLQLIKASPGEIADRATEVSEELRRFAHKEKITVIALSQLNRLASRERSRVPIKEDLNGGTALEANANQIVMLDHTTHIRDEMNPAKLRTRLILDKNRVGVARVAMLVEADFAKGVWREALPDEEHLWRAED
jgi:replicative DNA helicase